MRYLLFLLIVVPIIEIGILIRVGGWLGFWTTLAIIILTAVLGAWMLRQQSAATMMQAQQRLHAGQLPQQEIFEGLLLLFGGALLLTPGFVTDAWGFACLLPWSRRWLAGHVAKRVTGGIAFGSSTSKSPFSDQINRPGANRGDPFGGQPTGRPGGTPGGSGQPNSDDVIEGDFREVD